MLQDAVQKMGSIKIQDTEQELDDQNSPTSLNQRFISQFGSINNCVNTVSSNLVCRILFRSSPKERTSGACVERSTIITVIDQEYNIGSISLCEKSTLLYRDLSMLDLYEFTNLSVVSVIDKQLKTFFKKEPRKLSRNDFPMLPLITLYQIEQLDEKKQKDVMGFVQGPLKYIQKSLSFKIYDSSGAVTVICSAEEHLQYPFKSGDLILIRQGQLVVSNMASYLLVDGVHSIILESRVLPDKITNPYLLWKESLSRTNETAGSSQIQSQYFHDVRIEEHHFNSEYYVSLRYLSKIVDQLQLGRSVQVKIKAQIIEFGITNIMKMCPPCYKSCTVSEDGQSYYCKQCKKLVVAF